MRLGCKYKKIRKLDNMFSAEAAITIKQMKNKRRGVHLYNEQGDPIMAQRQRLINMLSKVAP